MQGFQWHPFLRAAKIHKSQAGDDGHPFLRMRRSHETKAIGDGIEVPAGHFVGAISEGGLLFHPRVPIHGLLHGQSADGTRWRLLRFGLDQPPNAR